jgi:flagellar capping protein FliD
MSGEVQIKFPAQFSHSVRIEQTAKGARITVRVFTNNQQEAINQAIQMYGEAKRRLEAEGHKIAPIEAITTATSTTGTEKEEEGKEDIVEHT